MIIYPASNYSEKLLLLNPRDKTIETNIASFIAGIYYSIKDGWEKRNVGEKMPLPHLVLLGGVAGVIGSFVSLKQQQQQQQQQQQVYRDRLERM